MRLIAIGVGNKKRLPGLIVLIILGTIVAILMLLAPDLQWFLPDVIRRRPVTMALAGLAAVYTLGRLAVERSRSERATSDPLHRRLDGSDFISAKLMSGGVTIVIAAVCLAFLAAWLPHYVLWPWARDADTFATLAQSWDAGIRPYRDIRGYNFPGAIYLFWVLGKACGWGRTWALYAFDATSLILLGVILAAWSRRCLGRMLPGSAGFLVFLTFYLNRDFETVAQRDGHASLCIVLGLLILEAWPGRMSRILSALLAAAALATRPHAVLFVPAMAAAVLEGADAPGLRPRRVAEWLVLFGVFTALAFSPLVLGGIADDLIRGLRFAAYGGPYSTVTPATVVDALAVQLAQPRTWIAIGGLGVVLAATRETSRRRALTWTLALGAALAYRLLHPVQHAYLAHPLALVSSVALAVPMGWLIETAGVPAFLRLAGVLVLVAEMNFGAPRFANPSAAVEAIRSIARGETLPVLSPPGSRAWFDPSSARWYAWEDYRKALSYLRESTSPATLVANVLQEPPYPAINGPAGRLSPFRAESGICWMLLVAFDLEPEFAAALERATDCVVVWSPEEFKWPSRLRLDRLAAAIRAHYEPEVRFGHIELWRRSAAASARSRPGPGHQFGAGRDRSAGSSSRALPPRPRTAGRTWSGERFLRCSASRVSCRKPMHISSVVCSPQRTSIGGLLGLRMLPGELSKCATISTLVPLGRATGLTNS
jgi:hypothetical protein